jgi:hypothetical protein
MIGAVIVAVTASKVLLLIGAGIAGVGFGIWLRMTLEERKRRRK